MQLTPLRTLTVERPLASGNSFLSAASGLVLLGSHICVVADDERLLAIFPADGSAPGRLIELLPGKLPRDAKKRKKQKPDFEMLVQLPPAAGHGARPLLALGSGSRAKRMQAALVMLTDDGGADTIRIIDLAPLYASIEPLVGELNLEGVTIDGDRLLLFNRGNMRQPETHIVATSLAALLAGKPPIAVLAKTLTLPAIAGVPLTVTDACQLADGKILLSAVAEVTDDSYADGEVRGAAFVRLDAALDVVSVEMIEPAQKVEGIALAANGDLLCVTDADDPEQPSMLYRVALA